MHRATAAVGIFCGDSTCHHHICTSVEPDPAALHSAARCRDDPAVVSGQSVDVAASGFQFGGRRRNGAGIGDIARTAIDHDPAVFANCPQHDPLGGGHGNRATCRNIPGVGGHCADQHHVPAGSDRTAIADPAGRVSGEAQVAACHERRGVNHPGGGDERSAGQHLAAAIDDDSRRIDQVDRTRR